eukprot:3848491-Rhodomonas_salina.2
MSVVLTLSRFITPSLHRSRRWYDMLGLVVEYRVSGEMDTRPVILKYNCWITLCKSDLIKKHAKVGNITTSSRGIELSFRRAECYHLLAIGSPRDCSTAAWSRTLLRSAECQDHLRGQHL